MPAKNGRNVSLTDSHSVFIDQLVASGRYGSASEVVREGLRLLEREEQRRLVDTWLVQGLTPDEEARIPPEVMERVRRAVRAKIDEGLDEARRGEFVDGERFFARWKARFDDVTPSTRRRSRVKKRG